MVRHERRAGPAVVPAGLWALFVNCAVVTAIIVPVHILIQGVLAPLGLVPAFDRRYATFAPALSNWLVKIYLFVLLATVFYTLGHRVRYLLTDLGVSAAKSQLGLLVYGLAALGIVVAAVVLVSVP
ncbi:MAG: hypothetical protein M3024_05675 [Candidatus Dormibacteraeota bacterium]|nr:hypothetical protein [Candidatus Dormibacteraeota bacterium]